MAYLEGHWSPRSGAKYGSRASEGRSQKLTAQLRCDGVLIATGGEVTKPAPPLQAQQRRPPEACDFEGWIEGVQADAPSRAHVTGVNLSAYQDSASVPCEHTACLSVARLHSR